jgi:hypothetical protein
VPRTCRLHGNPCWACGRKDKVGSNITARIIICSEGLTNDRELRLWTGREIEVSVIGLRLIDMCINSVFGGSTFKPNFAARIEYSLYRFAKPKIDDIIDTTAADSFMSSA